jgi:hypothetical protein
MRHGEVAVANMVWRARGIALAVVLLSFLALEPVHGFGSSEDLPGVPEISAGNYMSCGVRADNVAACWGDNVSEGPGQATPPAGVQFVEVNAGYHVACGVKTNNTLACWGNNTNGQASPPTGTFVHVSPGLAAACGLTTGKSIVCWGFNDGGVTMPPGGTFRQMNIGIRFGCALRDDGSGTVVCWGDNTYGQLNVPPGLNASYVNVGNFTACAIRTIDSTVVCWGRDFGQLTAPTGAFSTVSTGFNFVCGLRPDQTVTCWGANASGQSSPPAGTFRQVSAGAFHACGLRTDNTVVCWGLNTSGRVVPAFLAPAPPTRAAGTPYTYAFQTDYVSPAGTFTLAPGSGPLPPGLALSSNGTITGTPTNPGTYPGVVVQMTNGLSPLATTTVGITITGTAVGRQSLPGAVTASTGWSLQDSLTAGAPTTTFSYGTRPPALVPLTGDWDGNGSKTPGIYQGGAFKLSNSTTTNLTPSTTFAFGDPRGFPLSGDFDGNGTDDVALFRAGTWEIRYLGSGAPADAVFIFGSGTWPSVVPVAGDWNGDGEDGIGYYCRDSATCPAGTWNLRNTAGAGAPDAGDFIYNPGSTSYPVVGDWDANGTDTVGVRGGTTWWLNNANDTSFPDVDSFMFGGANDLPVVWTK